MLHMALHPSNHPHPHPQPPLQAMRVVLDSGCQYHMLLIIADGLVTTHPDDSPTPTMQETATAQALTDASGLPLSIVVVGVGDGPWTHNNTWCQPVRGKHHEAVTRPSGGRCFDNYHFVNATSVLHDAMQEGLDRRQCASRLAIHALMKVPEQYRVGEGGVVVGLGWGNTKRECVMGVGGVTRCKGGRTYRQLS